MTNGDADKSISRRGFLRATAGAATLAATSGAAAAQEGGETTEGGSGGGGGSTKTVKVGPGGDYVFTPGTDDPLVIAPGTTVKFVWESNGHNIVVDGQPDGAGWEGHEPLEDSGFSYEHTFDATGEYSYFCQPHKALGMTGTIEVKEGGAAAPSGPVEPPIPDSAKTLGIATLGGMTATLGFAYFFMKYGGDYERPE